MVDHRQIAIPAFARDGRHAECSSRFSLLFERDLFREAGIRFFRIMA